jgi:hypothetical protein
VLAPAWQSLLAPLLALSDLATRFLQNGVLKDRKVGNMDDLDKVCSLSSIAV